MTGRYGMDQLGQFLSGLLFVVILLNLFTRSHLLELVALAGLFYLYFRMFSKNIGKRYQENQTFLTLRFRITEKFRQWKTESNESKNPPHIQMPQLQTKNPHPKGTLAK